MSKPNSPAVLLAVVCLLLVTGLSPVQANNNAPVIVISPSQFAQPIHEVGSSVILLQADELRQRGIEFIEDALQEVPSLIVSSQGTRGSLVQARVRGNEANHVLILIDGMRVSNALTGEFDLSNLSMAAIENIEILLGPQSTIYGSDAMAGVINITTRKGGEGLSGNVKLGAGEKGILSKQLNLNVGEGGWHYSVTAENYKTDGISSAAEENGNTEMDSLSKQAFNVKTGYQGDHFSSSLILSRSESEFEFDSSDFTSGLAVDEEGNNQQVEIKNLAWLVSIPSTEKTFSNKFQLSRTSHDARTKSVFFGSDSEFNTGSDRDTLDYRGSYRINANNSQQYGFEIIEEALDIESISAFGVSEFNENASQSGVYINWLLKYNRLDLSAGIRSGHHEEFGSHDTYRVTASYKVTGTTRIRAAHGTAYKAPSLQELFDTSFGGNKNLQPEQSESSEVGIEYTLDDLQFSLTYFDQDTEDLIRFTGLFPTGVNRNVGKASSNGIELSASKSWGQFELTSGLSKINASETDNGVTSDRIRVPEWSANILSSYKFDHGRAWLQALYRDQRRDINFATATDVILDSYILWKLGASYRLHNKLTLSALIENPTDEKYEEVFSFGTRDRTAIVSANWVF